MPDVSAIVAACGRPAWADEAVQAILAQTQPPAEIIVADDGDGEVGRALAARYGVRAVCTGGQGPAAARNAAARLAIGEWLAFCDDDDVWAPVRLEAGLAAAGELCVLVFADAWRSDGGSELFGRKARGGHVFRDLLLDNWVPTSTVLLRRAAFEQAGGFDAHFSPAEDYRLWLAVSRFGQFAFIRQPLALYRQHEGQLQRRVADMAGASADAVEHAVAAAGWRPAEILGLPKRLRQLRFVQGRALMAEGRPAAARRAYLRAWRQQWHYANAPLFWMLSFAGK
jgi:glycosyltransferase involved in cell wall biosynthesis